MPAIDNLKQLAAHLRAQAAADGAIRLASEPPFEAIMAVVADVLGVSELVLSVDPDDIPDDPVGSLVIHNAYTPEVKAATFLGLIGQETTATFWYADAGGAQVLELSLVIALRQWTFGTSFLPMTDLPVNGLIPATVPPHFGFASVATDVVDPLTGDPIAIQKGLNYFAPVDMTAAAPFFTILQAAPPQLHVNGPIAKVADPPGEFAFDLRAPIAEPLAPLPLLTVSSPWLGMKAFYVFYEPSDDDPVDEARYTLLAYPYLGVSVQIATESGGQTTTLTLEVEVSVELSTGQITFLVLPADPADTSLDNIGSLIGGLTWDALIPASFRESYLSTFALTNYSLTLGLLRLGLVSMSLRLATLTPWPVPFTSYTLDFALDWNIVWQGTAMSQTAELAGNLYITEEFVFFTKVVIPEFTLTGGYTGNLKIDFTVLAREMQGLIGGTMQIPEGLPSFTFSDLTLTYASRTGAFSLECTTDATITLFGTQLLAIRGLFTSVSRDAAGARVSVLLNGVIEVLGIDFAVYANIPATGDTVFKIHMVDQTVGSLLAYIVRLVDPNFELSLEAPWNALLDIRLDALVLTINVTQGIVYLAYKTAINLGFIDITGIGLLYQTKKTDQKTGITRPSSAEISLECSFLGESYGGANPLAWNPMTSPPPAVPGDAALFDLNYLGLGQHVTPATSATTMVGIIEAMQRSMVPVDQGTTNPAQLPGVKFDEQSQWLIATRFSVMGAVELIAIWNDPDLYGLRVGLSSEKVGSFAGLAFEILYRKVTPTIGVYHLELTLPDAMRQLDFGQVSITLPVVALDIYTNGNFRVDVGFPKGLDFSRSAAVQVFPFVGFGGFYFAVLDGATSRNVPVIDNGTWSPVIELGLGLSLGVGKTIDKGIFKAGLSITLIGILEGVFAWFNPDDNSVSDELYYRVKGTVGILGKLYGAVDFKIIQVEVEVVVYATVALTVEAHAPIYIVLRAGVSVRASVKILFVRIRFSFSIVVEASFTIGSATPTPWHVVPSGGGAGQKQLSRLPTAHKALRGTALFGARADRAAQPELDWTPARVTHLVRPAKRLASREIAAARADAKIPLTIMLLPAFTQALEDTPGGPTPVAEALLLPFIQNPAPPSATGLHELRAIVANADETPFVVLASHLLAWVIHARLASVASPSPVVTAADLRLIYDHLTSHDIDQTGFSYENLVQLIAENFEIVLQVRPIDRDPADAVSATIFPILPVLTMTGAASPIDFGTYHPVDASYEEQINAYLRQLLVEYENGVEADRASKTVRASGRTAVAGAAAGDPPSMATIMFQNWFLMVARMTVQAAIDLLEAFPYTMASTPSPSLAAIAASLSTSEAEHTTATADETLQSIADSYGVLVSTLEAVNPQVDGYAPDAPLPQGLTLVIVIGALTEVSTFEGETLAGASLRYKVPVDTIEELNPAVASLGPTDPIPPGTRLVLPVVVTPESIVIANQDARVLLAGAALPIAGVAYQARDGDTFQSIAGRFVPGSAAFLDSLMSRNAGRAILRQGKALELDQATSGITYTTHPNDSVSLVATIYVVRISEASFLNSIDHLAEVIAEIVALHPPPEPPFTEVGPTTPIEPGTLLTFALPGGGVVEYVTNPLDTPTLVAAYFLTLSTGQLDLTGFVRALVDLNRLGDINPDDPIAAGTTLQIPTFTYVVQVGDSLARIGLLLNAGTAQLAAVEGLVAVHAVLDVPPFDHPIGADDTFQSVAESHALSLEALSSAIADQPGIFAAKTPDDKPVVVTVPRVPARYTAELIADLTANGDFNQPASMVSRFLLHGLRVPRDTAALSARSVADLRRAEVRSDVDTGPLYDLVGQQFPFPTPPVEGYEIGLTNTGAADWLSFTMSSYHAAAGSTLAGLAARFAYAADRQAFEAKLAELNPTVTFPLAEAAWLVFPADMPLEASALSLTKAEAEQAIALAGAKLSPDVRRLDPLPLYREAATRFGFASRIDWQAATLPPGTCLSGSGRRVSAPSIWPFPDGFQRAVDELPDPARLYERYTLMLRVAEDDTSPPRFTDVDCYLWGTLVDVRVKQIATSDGAAPNTYLVVGADPVGRALLADVWAYLDGEGKTNGAVATLSLLYPPEPTSAAPSGLLSGDVDPARTFLLRTNLATLTESGATAELLAAPPPPPEGIYDATFGDVANFVKLLWEASIVVGGGYYLAYATADGSGLPASLFTEGDEATLSLLVLVRDPTASAAHPPIGRIHNCAVVGQNVDGATASLFVEPITHIVVPGDTLASVAGELDAKFTIALDAAGLAVANQDVKGLLLLGATLDVGGAQPYTIVYGDTLESVAEAHSMTVPALVATGQNASTPILEPGALMQIASGQLRLSATTPPGNIGFELLRTDPDDGGAETPAEYLDTLFQLLAFGIAPKYRFVETGEGLPAGPSTSEQEATDGVRVRSLVAAGADEELWRYQSVLPISRYANDGLGSDIAAIDPDAALPPPVRSPYRGIYVDPASGTSDLFVELDFDLRDIYGNTTAPDVPVGPLTIPVGYTDDLVGLDSWPGLSATQIIGAGPEVRVDLAFQIGNYVAGPETPYDNAIQNAGAHRASYATIVYQAWQPDLIFRLRTTLDQPPDGAPPADGYPGDTMTPPRVPYLFTRAQKVLMMGTAASIYAFLTAARSVNAFEHVIREGETPAGVASAFGATTLALFEANAERDAAEIFGASARLLLPTYYAVRGGDTLAGIASVVSADDVLAYDLDVPFNAGLDIGTPERTPPYTLKAGDTLRAIAAAVHASAPVLAETNELHPLTAGESLSIGGVTLPVGPGATLQSMAGDFKSKGVDTTAAALGVANQDTPDLFDRAADPDLRVADYVLRQGDTLASIQRALGFAPADVLAIERNGALINLYVVGTKLQNGTAEYQLQPGDTLSSVARQNGATLDQLAALNGGAALAEGPKGYLSIPLTVALDEASPPASTFRASAAMTLAEIAARYIVPASKQPLDAAGLAELNRHTPYLFAPGATIAVGAFSVTIGDTDTLATLHAELVQDGYAGSFADFATAIASSTGILEDGALFACPPIQTGSRQTVAQVAATFGADARALMEANRSLSGLFEPQSLSYGGATVEIGASDTFLSIVNRFAALGVTVTFEIILHDPAFASVLADRAFMLPAPTLAAIDVGITSTPVNPAAIFPVTVEIELARRLDLVAPDFADARTVSLAQSAIAPKTAKRSSGDAVHALTDYAEAFEPTFGGLIKITTGQTIGQQIWAADFRPGALSYDIEGDDTPDPFGDNPLVRYFALEPLANHLVSEPDVTIIPYVPGIGLDPSRAEMRTFQSVDLDVWARDFLSAVDQFLAPETAASVYRLPADGDPEDRDGAYQYRRVVQAKGSIATSVKRGVGLVFVESGGDLANAQEALEQRLLIELSNAYAIDTIAQLPVATSSPDADASTAPRLSGKPVTVAGATSAPDAYSLSTAKVPLVGSAPGDGASWLTFLVNAKDDAAQRDVKLDLRYAINEVEYDIHAVRDLDGYQASSWLTFVLPIGGPADARLRAAGAGRSLEERARIGTLDIPIPLRAYPPLPSLVDQTGVGGKADASLPLPELIAKLTSWDYACTFDYPAASQDTTYLKVVFNGEIDAAPGPSPDADVNRELFAALAQFATDYPAIKADLATISSAADGSATASALKAARAFADLVEIVDEAWKEGPASWAALAVQRRIISYAYRVDVDAAAQTLTLRGDSTTEHAYLWPDIEALVWDEAKGRFEAYPLVDKQVFPDHATYEFPFTVSPLPARYRYTWKELPITAYQSGIGSVRVKRNENLGRSQGKVVAQSFVYQTPSIAFSNPFTPLVLHGEDVSIEGAGATLAEALDVLFTLLLFAHASPEPSINVKIACRYGYTLAASGASVAPPLRTLFPLRLLPRFDFQLDPAWRTAFTARLAEVLLDWQSGAAPATANGAFIFDISLYAGPPGQVDQPLLRLQSVYYPVASQPAARQSPR